MESQIIDYYKSDPHNVNIIEKLLEEINQLEEKLKHKNDRIHKYKIPHLLAYTLEDKIKHIKRKQQTIETITKLIDKEYATFLFDKSPNGLGIESDIYINEYRENIEYKLNRQPHIEFHKKQKTIKEHDPRCQYDLFIKIINIIDEYTFYKNRDWCILFVETIFNTIYTRYNFLIEYMRREFRSYKYDQLVEQNIKLSNMEVVHIFFRNKNKRIKNIHTYWCNYGTYLSSFNEIKKYLLKLLIGTDIRELNHPNQRYDNPDFDKDKSWKTIIPVHLQNIDNSLFFSIHDDVDIKDSRYWNCCIENTAYFYCPECKRCKNSTEVDLGSDYKRIQDKQVNNDRLKLMCHMCFLHNICKLKLNKNKTEQQQKLYEDYKKLDDIMRNHIDTDDDY
tara:strand:+ start:619 stop:1791 length:1173 start_codon:yes stop_codon:yes gene_type:complete